MQLTTPWHEKGKIEGVLNIIIRYLRKRFDQIPTELEESIKVLSPKRLEEVGEAILELKGLAHLRTLGEGSPRNPFA